MTGSTFFFFLKQGRSFFFLLFYVKLLNLKQNETKQKGMFVNDVVNRKCPAYRSFENKNNVNSTTPCSCNSPQAGLCWGFSLFWSFVTLLRTNAFLVYLATVWFTISHNFRCCSCYYLSPSRWFTVQLMCNHVHLEYRRDNHLLTCLLNSVNSWERYLCFSPES